MNFTKNMKHQIIQKLVLGLAFFSFAIVFSQNESDNPLKKKETIFKGVYDYAKLLSPQEATSLSRKLINYSDTTSTQIAIAIVKSLNGQEISMLTAEKAHDWGIGQKGKDNGVFIVIAQQERKINISTGYGVEHLLTDYKSKEIIDQIITPSFKNQQYYQGLDKATTAIIQILAGTYKADPKEDSGGINFVFIIFIVIVIFIIINNKNSGKGNKNRRLQRDSADILTSVILSSMGRSSRSSGGFGNGGSFGSGGSFGGSFGGGGFGGGGASGGW